MFNRSMHYLLETGSLEYLKESLNEFYSSFLEQTLFSSLDLCAAVNGIHLVIFSFTLVSRFVLHEYASKHIPGYIGVCP